MQGKGNAADTTRHQWNQNQRPSKPRAYVVDEAEEPQYVDPEDYGVE